MKPSKKEIQKHIAGSGSRASKSEIVAEIQRLANDKNDNETRPKIMALLWVYRGQYDNDIAVDLIDQTMPS